MTEDKFDAAVVGAGPAGMMAAIRAAQNGLTVVLFERNHSCGRKLLLSGKGRCNLSNACSQEDFFCRFSHNGVFLRNALSKFSYPELQAFFEERGLKLCVERQDRVFPSEGSAADVLDVLLKELQDLRVDIRCESDVKDIMVSNSRVKGILLEGGETISFGKVILACGGLSYAFTGSNGDGLEIARRHGHTITPILPALAPLQTKQRYSSLKGLTLKNVRVRFYGSGKKVETDVGEVTFHSQAIGGALALSHSGTVAGWLASGADARLEIDLKPGLDRVQLDERLLRECKSKPQGKLKNVLFTLMPEVLAGVFCGISGLDPETRTSQLKAAERARLSAFLKALPFDICAVSLEEAMVTRGGVSLKEVDPRTMGSRLVKGLYFAGEMLDLDADTGGFNLQAAFSSGYLAGEGCVV